MNNFFDTLDRECHFGTLCFLLVNCCLSYKGDIPRPDAGYFALGGKVTKTPLKPLRFQPSRLK